MDVLLNADAPSEVRLAGRHRSMDIGLLANAKEPIEERLPLTVVTIPVNVVRTLHSENA